MTIKKEETAVATIPTAHPAPISIDRMALAFAQSGFFKDAADAAKALVKIQFGLEMGIGPAASMSGVHIIEGKPTMGANLMASALKKGGKYNYRVLMHTEEECVIEFYEAGKPVGKSSFSMDDARNANLANRPVWKSYGRNMLFSRAISNGIRWYCPDIFGGSTVYTPEELDANVPVDVVAESVETPTPAPQVAETPAPTTPAVNQEHLEKLKKKVFARMKAVGVTASEMKEWSSSKIGKNSTKDWNIEDCDEALGWLEAQVPIDGEMVP